MTTNDDEARARYSEVATLAGKVLASLRAEVEKLGFDPAEVTLQAADQALYRLDRDPSDGSHSLVGEWRDERGMKLGQLLFHADGSFFVEQDVARPHPNRRQWFVEAVNAWGRAGEVKAEARLLPMPE